MLTVLSLTLIPFTILLIGNAVFLSTSTSKPAITTFDIVARAAVVVFFAAALELQSRRRVFLGPSATTFYIFLFVALVYWLSGLVLSHL